jgi:hypothetical protein
VIREQRADCSVESGFPGLLRTLREVQFILFMSERSDKDEDHDRND